MPLSIHVPDSEKLHSIAEAVEAATDIDVFFDFGSGVLNILCLPEEEEQIIIDLTRAGIQNVCDM